MKKLLVVLVLVVLAAALAAPSLAENGSRDQALPETARDILSQLGDKGDELLDRLKEYFATHESGEIARHLSNIFRQTENLTDQELDAEIRAAAEGVSLELSDEQVAWLRALCRKYEKVDEEQLRQMAEDWKEKLPDLGSLQDVLERLQAAGELLRDVSREAGRLWDDSRDMLGNLRELFRGFAGTDQP